LPYIGNIPAEKYAAFNVQYFTTSATATYTLDRAVANELDIRLVINNVIQEPGSGKAYTAAGTTLTLSAATAGSDTMYCVYIGKAVQTVNPGAGSVGTTALADNAVTNAKLADATQGDVIYYAAAGAPAQLSAGTNGHFLKTQGAGANPTWAAVPAGTTLTGSTNNQVTTVTGADAITGETNLTFDGNDLTLGNGNIVFGTASKGVYLGVTSATASNLLDDYEFGDFTPTWTAVGSGSISATPTNFAKYVKSGRQVTVSVSTIFQTSGTFTDYKITNLPFTQSMIGAGTGVEYGQVGCGLMIQGVNNSTQFLVKRYDGGFIANAYVMLSYTYIATA